MQLHLMIIKAGTLNNYSQKLFMIDKGGAV